MISLANPPVELAPLLEPGYRLLEDPDAVEEREARENEEAFRRAENRARLATELAVLPEHLRLGFFFENLGSDRLHFSPATHRHLLTVEDLESVLPLLQASVEVDVSGLPVSEELLGGLAGSSTLSELDLSETLMGNEVFDIFASAPAIERLNLFGTEIDAAAEIPTDSFANLQQLFVAKTEADLEALRAALPHVDMVGGLDLALPDPEEEEKPEADY